ncbi:ABC transporter substrate-binding protein [Bradyrhizobium sp. AUGA SZCCT0222]|uniref:ABC transporter substrate-binding protein n=1 Tax=Bradyrhizobium sp. AUGA SZCCT0222 TaxID=2807668 RepID=UPI001BA5EEF4|nr:ABC transporter substrate-binding protein [Bradyrhizobium sp. AUGA SZCCT0222]MBR1267091.1 ABC transporter substrate-binding protein [Bradyrhizobium sp. AUGA SZCCT0222]
MRMRRVAQAVLTAALSVAGYSACGANEPYKIGMLTSMSGYVANMGLGGRDGLMLAVDEINKRGGVHGRMIKIIPLNDESDATKGVPLAVNLIEGEKVLAVVGPVRSDIVEAVAPMMEKSQVVDMVCSTILPTKHKYAFATAPTPDEEAPVAIAFMKKNGAKSVAILSALDVWARTLAKAWADEAEKQGLKVVAAESYNSATDKNFIPQLSKFKSANADWILVTGAGPAAGLILKQKAEIGYTASVFGSTTFPVAGISALVQIGGPAAVEGTYFATVPFSVWDTFPQEDPRYKTIAQFREAFKVKYNNYPDLAQWWIAQNYDIGMLLAEGIKRAGPNVTGATLKAALESIQNYQGVLGVSFSYSPERHSGVSGVVVGQIKDGKVVLVK